MPDLSTGDSSRRRAGREGHVDRPDEKIYLVRVAEIFTGNPSPAWNGPRSDLLRRKESDRSAAGTMDRWRQRLRSRARNRNALRAQRANRRRVVVARLSDRLRRRSASRPRRAGNVDEEEPCDSDPGSRTVSRARGTALHADAARAR